MLLKPSVKCIHRSLASSKLSQNSNPAIAASVTIVILCTTNRTYEFQRVYNFKLQQQCITLLFSVINHPVYGDMNMKVHTYLHCKQCDFSLAWRWKRDRERERDTRCESHDSLNAGRWHAPWLPYNKLGRKIYRLQATHGVDPITRAS